MSADKLVDSAQLDASLTYEAGKIRAKLGGSAQLDFDLANEKGFGDYIDAIPSGGGTDYLGEIFDGSITHYENDTITVISKGARAFENQINLVSVSFPKLTEIKASFLFALCAALTSVNMPKLAKNTGLSVFSQCTSLSTIVLPSFYNTTQNYVMEKCTALISADFGSAGLSTSGNIFNQNFFNGCTSLNTIVLRANDRVQGLGNVNTFTNTPFASDGVGGTLYVPSSLVSSYQGATNWSTILGYANNQIKSIESTHTDPNAPIDLTLYYADGTLIPT